MLRSVLPPLSIRIKTDISALRLPQICAIINACFIPFTEGWAPFLAIPRIGFFVMFTNALNAFLLNVSAVFLIGKFRPSLIFEEG